MFLPIGKCTYTSLVVIPASIVFTFAYMDLFIFNEYTRKQLMSLNNIGNRISVQV